MLYREVRRRKPIKRAHREIVGATIVENKLVGEIFKGKERVERVETLLILSVAAFNLAIVAGSIGTDKLVTNTELRGSVFKQGGQIPLRVGETVGELKAVVGLNTLHGNPPASEPEGQLP